MTISRQEAVKKVAAAHGDKRPRRFDDLMVQQFTSRLSESATRPHIHAQRIQAGSCRHVQGTAVHPAEADISRHLGRFNELDLLSCRIANADATDPGQIDIPVLIQRHAVGALIGKLRSVTETAINIYVITVNLARLGARQVQHSAVLSTDNAVRFRNIQNHRFNALPVR